VTTTLDFSQIVRAERNRLGLTQAELGQRVGVSDSYVAHMESGLKTPSPYVTIALADVFGFTAQQQQALLEAVEDARLERTSRRIRIRGRAVRGALRARALAGAGVITLVDPATGLETGTLPVAGRYVRFLSLSPDGRLLASADEQGTTSIWNLSNAEPERMLEFGDTPLTALTFLLDGKHVATVDEDSVLNLWDAAGGKPLPLENAVGRIVTLASSPDGSLLAMGDDDGQLAVCAGTDGTTRWTVDAHTGPIESIAFSPDGSRLATGGRDGFIRIWRSASGKEERDLEHHGAVFALGFSPDGRLLAGGGDGPLKLWIAAGGEELSMLPAAPSSLMRLAFHADGVTLKGICQDGTVLTWDTRTRAPGQSTQLRGGPFHAFALSADSQRLAVFDAGRNATSELSAEVIARELAADRDLLAAYRDLRAGLANPTMRETVLKALRAFARDG
jgi:WD40 repeat protein